MKPVEARLALRWRMLARPENPSGKHAIEKSLHERRAEKVVAFLILELNSECLLKRGSDSCKRRHVALFLNPPQGLTRVRSQEPGYILGRCQRRSMEHHALEEVRKRLPLFRCDRAGMAGGGPEVSLIPGQPIAV